ncbi:DinB family protein [Paenibacillus sp. NEAU-GSW1]|uniref:DinB family protein n=1 Tax=Paenibacillus sp. NEAU-GSW1 TaxID=2682486 RepID=UPI0012E2F3E7|nr:DinB family protein [Paenibacillus sp. NEAU-GSW1]MUT64541.1 DUF664 domain-containing protein [Paenibacillus sp. NEAU-GSW1]
MIGRPQTEEYNVYYSTYVSMVPEGDIAQILREQLEETTAALSAISEERGDYRYAPGKWSIKQVIGHLADNERIMSYRMLRIARGDQTPLPGYDQNAYMATVDFAENSLRELIEDFAAARKSTLSLIALLPGDGWVRTGSANNSPLSARALAYIIAGHATHHLNGIKTNYLK